MKDIIKKIIIIALICACVAGSYLSYKSYCAQKDNVKIQHKPVTPSHPIRKHIIT